MLRRFARAISPLVFAPALLILGISLAVAGEPLKPETKAADSKPEPSKSAAKSDNLQTSQAAAGETSEATIGEPLAPGMIEILQQEIRSAVRTRGIDDNFARFQRYSGYQARYVRRGLYRLGVGGQLPPLLVRPHAAAPLGRRGGGRAVHARRAYGDCQGPRRLGSAAADHRRQARPAEGQLSSARCESTPKSRRRRKRWNVVKQALIEARAAQAAALAPLTKGEIRRAVGEHLSRDDRAEPRGPYAQRSRHRPPPGGPDGEDGPRRDGHRGRGPAPAERSGRARPVEELSGQRRSATCRGLPGTSWPSIETPAGAIIIGGKEANTYNLDSLGDVALVIDLGGENTYNDGTVSIDRPLLVNVNLGGHNVYRSSKPAVQGGSILGVSMIVNTEGGNRYDADRPGPGLDDRRRGDHRRVRRRQHLPRRAAGAGPGHRRRGDHRQPRRRQQLPRRHVGPRARRPAGLRHPRRHRRQRPLLPGRALSELLQAGNAGLRGLWPGRGRRHPPGRRRRHRHAAQRRRPQRLRIRLSLARRRLLVRPGLRPRLRRLQQEPHRPQEFLRRRPHGSLFQRFGCGWGCHYAQGFCFDDKGHSTFEGSIMGSGMGWDCSLGALCVFGGDNHFEAANSLVQGCGAQGSVGILYQYGDDSDFKGYGQGYASSNLTYHNAARLRRQLQLPGLLRRGQQVRLRRAGALDHPARHGRRIPHQPAPPRSAEPTPTAKRPGEKTTAGP